MTRQFCTEVIQGFAVAAVIGAILLLASIASAQEDDATVLVLAISAVAEADFDAPDDHAAIWHVLAKRADLAGVTVQEMAVRYVAAWKVTDERTRWLRGLRLDAHKPDGWPMHLAWSAYVQRWLRVIDHARAFVAGEVRDPCPAARHWGGRGIDSPRGRMVSATCAGARGRLANRFYRLGAR